MSSFNSSPIVTSPSSSSSSADDSVESITDFGGQGLKNKVHSNSSSLNEMAKFKVVQIGCGVVGNAYALAFVNGGHEVIGVEASQKRIDELAGLYTMRHVNDEMLDISGVDFILLSINTPLDPKKGALNMKYLWSSLKNVGELLTASPKALVVVRSTVTIGFCMEYKKALCDLLSRDDVPVCFQPEFLRAKSALEDATKPWQVVIGCEKKEHVVDYVSFQACFVDPRRISLCTIDEAEIMKIFHNSFNAAKISFFNQAGLLIDRVKERDGKDIDAERTFKLIGRTCEGLLNPNYGLTPGHAYYGTCLPKDSAELANMETKYGLNCDLFSQVVNVNNVMRGMDEVEVLYGDNHVDNKLFHERSAPNEKPLALNVKNAQDTALATKQKNMNSSESPNCVKAVFDNVV